MTIRTIRDYQNCSVLRSTVVHNDTCIREQFLKLTFDLGLAVCVFLCFSLNYFVHALFAFVVIGLVSNFLQYGTKPRDWWEEHLRNDLFCVEWAVRPQLKLKLNPT